MSSRTHTSFEASGAFRLAFFGTDLVIPLVSPGCTDLKLALGSSGPAYYPLPSTRAGAVGQGQAKGYEGRLDGQSALYRSCSRRRIRG